MKISTSRLTLASAIAVTVALSANSQPASAQVLELVTGTINSLVNRPPKPIPNQNFTGLTGNGNGNTVNLCVMPCSPGGNVPLPQTAPRLAVPQNQVIPGNIPPGGVAVPPQQVQPTPPRPVLVVPPIKLPVNLPL